MTANQYLKGLPFPTQVLIELTGFSLTVLTNQIKIYIQYINVQEVQLLFSLSNSDCSFLVPRQKRWVNEIPDFAETLTTKLREKKRPLY